MGNLLSVTLRSNYRGQAYRLDYRYDMQTSQFVDGISDSFGYGASQLTQVANSPQVIAQSDFSGCIYRGE